MRSRLFPQGWIMKGNDAGNVVSGHLFLRSIQPLNARKDFTLKVQADLFSELHLEELAIGVIRIILLFRRKAGCSFIDFHADEPLIGFPFRPKYSRAFEHLPLVLMKEGL